MDAFHMRPYHAHDGVALVLNGLFTRHHRHGRIGHLYSGVPEDSEALPLGLNIKRMGKVRGVDEFCVQGLKPIRWRTDRKPSNVALGIDTVFSHHYAMKKIPQGT